MTVTKTETAHLTATDLIDIERQARAMQARAMAEMMGNLRRAIVARLRFAPAAQTA